MTKSIKNIKYLGINWLQNKGSQELILEEKNESNIIIKSVTYQHSHMWSCITPKSFLKKIIEVNAGFHEVLTTFPFKVYFDIDKKNNTDKNFREKILNKINSLFPDADMAVSGSITTEKDSYHITLNNYTIDNEEERDYIKSLVKYLFETYDDSFDWRVYTKNRPMKAINQSKPDGRIQKILINKDPKKHLITCFFNDELYELPKFDDIKFKEIKLSIDVEKSKKPFNIGYLPVLEPLKLTEDHKDRINNLQPLEILNLLRLTSEFDHDYTHLVARYCYSNGLTIENFLTWYQQKSNTIESKLKWTYHWSNLDKFPPVSTIRMMKILIKYYPEIRISNNYQKFVDSFKNLDVITVPRLSQDVFNNSDKIIILNTGMGTGKSTQTIQYLKQIDSFIWIIPLVALSSDINTRLKNVNIECVYYSDLENKNMMNIYDKLMVCLNSLHYTSGKQYKVVVIDEVETLLNKWFNNKTLDNVKTDCWTRFIKILQEADKIILLDAFTSQKTISFFRDVLPQDKPLIYQLEEELSDRTVHFISDVMHWLKDIIDKLKENKKVFIFYPFKKSKKNHFSMQQIRDIIQKETGKTSLMYNADVSDKVLNTLKNVNESWSKVDFVITNSKITVGVSYDKPDFDTIYLALAGFTSCRDAVQVSNRCREIQSDMIKVCYLEQQNTNRAFVNDDVIVKRIDKNGDYERCPIYQNLVKNILVEQYSPIKKTFIFFCKLAHYNISTSKNDIDKFLTAYYNDLVEDDLVYNYSSITIINDEELQLLEHKIKISEATIEDKMSVKKYYFLQKLNDNSNEILLETIWNKNWFNFLDKLKIIVYHDNNIFYKIRDLNKWSSIIPYDDELKKIKLNEDIIKQIFKEFHFKNINITSSPNVIIKNVYNTFFNRAIIITECEKKNYYNKIEDETREIFNFMMKNIKFTSKEEDLFLDDEEEIVIKDIDKIQEDDLFLDENNI